MCRIRLTEEEKQNLKKLYKTSENSVVRERSFILLLSNTGYCIVKIASVMNITRQTIATLLSSWETAPDDQKLSVLSVAPGRGAKVKLAPVSDLIPGLAEKYSRNLNPMFDTLESEHGIKISKSTLRNFLKEVGL